MTWPKPKPMPMHSWRSWPTFRTAEDLVRLGRAELIARVRAKSAALFVTGVVEELEAYALRRFPMIERPAEGQMTQRKPAKRSMKPRKTQSQSLAGFKQRFARSEIRFPVLEQSDP